VEEAQRSCEVIDTGVSWETAIARSPLEPVHLLRGRMRVAKGELVRTRTTGPAVQSMRYPARYLQCSAPVLLSMFPITDCSEG
jgi:hypothetical protein